jgi:transposase
MEPMLRHIRALARTPVVLHALLEEATPEQLVWKPARGRWSASEVLGHLIDVERAFRCQSRRVVEETRPLLAPYDAAAEYARGTYSGKAGRRQLRRFLEARRRSVAWLGLLPPGAWARRGEHSVLGPVQLEQMIHLWAFHDLGHVRQLTEIVRAACHWTGIGPLQRFYHVNP